MNKCELITKQGSIRIEFRVDKYKILSYERYPIDLSILCYSYKAVFGAGAPMCFPKQELGKEMKNKQLLIAIVMLSIYFKLFAFN